MRRPPLFLAFAAACSGDALEAPVAPEVVVMASCSDARCEERVVEAVTLAGEPTAWTWTLPDGSTERGAMITTTRVNDLDVYEVLATDDDGGSHLTKSAVVSLEVAAIDQGEPLGDKDITIVIVPLGAQCDRIPVVSIGGCITADTLVGLHIDAADTHFVGFSTASGNYTSTQSTPRAVWKIGSMEGWAPGTSFSDYYTSTLPAPTSSDHFTAYVEALQPGTSTVLVSHGSGGGETFASHEIAVTCDDKGRITQLQRRRAGP